MNFPDQLKYSNDHEWIRIDGEEAFIGITDYAQSELGEIVFVDVDAEGESLSTGEVFGSVEAVKTVSDLMMPVDGEILEVNAALEDQPELVNSDPYVEGWIVKIKVGDIAQVNDLMNAAQYTEFVGK